MQNDVKTLHDFSFYTQNVDLVGHIVFNEKQQEVLNFGKYKGRPVEDVFRKEPSYYDWMMKSQFPLVYQEGHTGDKEREWGNRD